MRRLFSVATVAAALAFAGAAQAQNVTMRISHQVPTAHHLHKMLEGFAADVAQRSGGSVTVQIFPAEQLHKATENHPAVARGAVEAALSVNQQWGNTIPEMNVVVIPYFFSELERIRKFPGSDSGQAARERSSSRRASRTSRGSTSRARRSSPRARSRCWRRTTSRASRSAASTRWPTRRSSRSARRPRRCPGSEVYNALQTGVLDAGVTDVSAAYSRRYYEVQKFGTVTPSFTVYFHLYVNPGWYAQADAGAPRRRSRRRRKKAEQDAIGITEKTRRRRGQAAAGKGHDAEGPQRRRRRPRGRRPCRSRSSTPSSRRRRRTARSSSTSPNKL